MTGKLRGSVKANNLHLKCTQLKYGVGSNKIYEKTPRKTPNAVYFAPRNRFLSMGAV